MMNLKPWLQAYKGQTVNVTVLRDGETLNKLLRIDADGKLGIYRGVIIPIYKIWVTIKS